MDKLAVKMLLGDKGKYLSLVVGLAFAALLIAQQGAIFLGLLERATGALQNVVQPDLWVADPRMKFIAETRALNDDDIFRVRSVGGVAWAEPLFNGWATCELPDGSFKRAQIVGIDRNTLIGQPPEVTAGSLSDLRAPDAVFVEESSRPKLNNVEIGQTLKLNDRRAVVVGFCRAKLGFESNALLYSTYDNALRFVPQGRRKMTFILVGVKPGADRQEVARRIGAIPGLAAFTPKEVRDRTIEFVLLETGIGINFGITVVLGFVVGLIVAAATFYQFTVENQRYFAVLKAMGAKSRTLVRMVLLQAGMVGAIGYGAGVGLASVFTILSRRPGSELAAYFPLEMMFATLAAMVLCVGAGSVLSLRRVIKLDPAIVFK